MQKTPSDYFSGAIPEWEADQRDGGNKAAKQAENNEIPVSQVQYPQPYYLNMGFNGCGDYVTLTDCQAQAVRDFVDVYYRTLAAAPQDAWRHYTATAQHAHADGQLNAGGRGVRPAVGQRQVHAAIVYQRFAECRFRVDSVIAQRTPAGDHVALAAGSVCRRGRPPCPFVQTFVLRRSAATGRWAISNAMLQTNHE